MQKKTKIIENEERDEKHRKWVKHNTIKNKENHKKYENHRKWTQLQ